MAFKDVLVLEDQSYDNDVERKEKGDYLRSRFDLKNESSDRALVESILSFTCMLFDHCSNRSLYKSGDRLNHLLNTGSLSLLKHALELAFRMAKRVWASRARSSTTTTPENLLRDLYGLDTDHIVKIAVPFLHGNHAASDKEDDQIFHYPRLSSNLKAPHHFRHPQAPSPRAR
jgi:hypothetical protein